MLGNKRLSDLEKSSIIMACEIARLSEELSELRKYFGDMTARETTSSPIYPTNNTTYTQQNAKQMRRTGEFVALPPNGEKVEVLRRFRMDRAWYADVLHECGTIDTRYIGGAEAA